MLVQIAWCRFTLNTRIMKMMMAKQNIVILDRILWQTKDIVVMGPKD